jgi:enamine deaminase RidA (YjgF/YER057c/UK114 family)
MAGEIEARLKALDLVLPEAKTPVGAYVPFLHLNGQLFISGQLPFEEGKLVAKGQVGADLDLSQGQQAARICAINILAQAKAALRDLDRIVQLLRLNGFVNAAPGFADHPKVLNAASELMVKVLGNRGLHTRVAVGCASLPLNAAVEIDATFAVD